MSTTAADLREGIRNGCTPEFVFAARRPVATLGPCGSAFSTRERRDIALRSSAVALSVKGRVADLDSGRVHSIPWEQVRQRLLDKLNAR